jgi:hypothetical protein
MYEFSDIKVVKIKINLGPIPKRFKNSKLGIVKRCMGLNFEISYRKTIDYYDKNTLMKT